MGGDRGGRAPRWREGNSLEQLCSGQRPPQRRSPWSLPPGCGSAEGHIPRAIVYGAEQAGVTLLPGRDGGRESSVSEHVSSSSGRQGRGCSRDEWDATLGTTDVYHRAVSCEEPLGASKAPQGQEMCWPGTPHPQPILTAGFSMPQVRRARGDVTGVQSGVSCPFSNWQGGAGGGFGLCPGRRGLTLKGERWKRVLWGPAGAAERM